MSPDPQSFVAVGLPGTTRESSLPALEETQKRGCFPACFLTP